MIAEEKLENNLTLSTEQQEAVGFLTEFSKRMVVMGLERGRSQATAVGLMKEIYQICDDLLEASHQKTANLACRRGCHWCCCLRVTATPLEILCIVELLRSMLEPGPLLVLKGQVEAIDRVTHGLDGEQRVSLEQPCPLLVDGECLVYPVRPITCRFYHSLDVEDCRVSLYDPLREVRVQKNIFEMGLAVSAGLREGLGVCRLKDPMLELIAGLKTALDRDGDELLEVRMGGGLLQGEDIQVSGVLRKESGREDLSGFSAEDRH